MHAGDALASAGDEGRAKPRKCHARRKGSLTMAIPNGETHAFAYPLDEYIVQRRLTRGTETSKYPEEKKSTEIPSVVVSERGGAQTGSVAWRSTEAGWKKTGGPPSKAKYELMTDSAQYREGKVKSTPRGE